jgi:iron(III) transport system ATP-binding protein
LSKKTDDFVKIRGLTKSYGGHIAVDNVSFDVAEGHTLALLGPSGCGKTTMLRCIAGLEHPEEGLIEIAGKVVYAGAQRIDLMPEHRDLGIVFQSYAVWPHMTVAENVAFPLKVRGISKVERTERVTRILDIVGLGAWHDRSATALSGGQQQRVALARALVHEPRLVLFDEALSNLDTQLRERMRTELKVLQDRLHFTAIYVTHDQAEAFALAEHVMLMNRGRVETQGKPRYVFSRPATAFVARFLGLNVVPGIVMTIEGDIAQVRLGDGLILRGVTARDAMLKSGDRIVACMRPEHLKLSKTAPQAAAQAFKGHVIAVSFLGLDEEYVLQARGVELRVVERVGDIEAGGEVIVSLSPDACFVLPETAPESDPATET